MILSFCIISFKVLHCQILSICNSKQTCHLFEFLQLTFLFHLLKSNNVHIFVSRRLSIDLHCQRISGFYLLEILRHHSFHKFFISLIHGFAIILFFFGQKRLFSVGALLSAVVICWSFADVIILITNLLVSSICFVFCFF